MVVLFLFMFVFDLCNLVNMFLIEFWFCSELVMVLIGVYVYKFFCIYFNFSLVCDS